MKRAREETLILILPPRDVLTLIISWLDIQTFFKSRRVSKQWKHLIDTCLSNPNTVMDRGIWDMCHAFVKRKYIHTRPLIPSNFGICACGSKLYSVDGLHWHISMACMRPRCFAKTDSLSLF